jgi:hypothetical protein
MFVLFCDGPFWLAFKQNTAQAMNPPKNQRMSIFSFGTYITYKDRSLAQKYGINCGVIGNELKTT